MTDEPGGVGKERLQSRAARVLRQRGQVKQIDALLLREGDAEKIGVESGGRVCAGAEPLDKRAGVGKRLRLPRRKGGNARAFLRVFRRFEAEFGDDAAQLQPRQQRIERVVMIRLNAERV